MTKNDYFEAFKCDYQQIAITETKANEFAKIVCKLLDNTFIIQSLDEDVDDYRAACTFLNALKDYFALMDMSLCFDDDKKIIYLESFADHNRYRLSKLETVTILILRGLMFEISQEARLNDAVYATSHQIWQKLITTGIFKKDPNKTDFRNALKTLRQYRIISYSGDELIDETKIQILNSILIVVNGDNLVDLSDRLSKFKGDNDNETSDTDQAD